jgi:acyl carrier protein
VTTTLTDDQILTEIRDQLAAMKVPDAHDATLDSQWADLDVDSLELVELVKALEDRYGITIADSELKPIKGVGDAVTLVQRLAGTISADVAAR